MKSEVSAQLEGAVGAAVKVEVKLALEKKEKVDEEQKVAKEAAAAEKVMRKW